MLTRACKPDYVDKGTLTRKCRACRPGTGHVIQAMLSVFFGLKFSRTVSPESSKGPALIAFMKHYKWTKAIMLTSTDAALFRSGLELAEKLQRGGINMFKPAAFVPGHFKIETLGEVKHMGIRIVILMAFNRDLHDID